MLIGGAAFMVVNGALDAPPDYSGRIVLGVICALIIIAYGMWSLRGRP